MTTTGEQLVILSGLGSSTALVHFAAITTGGAYPTAAQIAAAVLASLNATTIPVDVQLMNGAEVIGDGTNGNPWRGVGVSP